MKEHATNDGEPDTCTLCHPNCARCDIAYNNCISCKTGWVLLVVVDTANAAVASVVYNADYCIPGDGVSHWHSEGLHGTISATAGSGTLSNSNDGAAYKHQCLQAFTERPLVKNLLNFLHNELNSADNVAVGTGDRYCYSAQCHPSCYTCAAQVAGN